MAWRDTLSTVRDDLAQLRAERQRQSEEENARRQERQQELTRISGSLEVTRLLDDMNDILIRGQGHVETEVSWELSDDDEPDDDEDVDMIDVDEELVEDADYITAILTWEEDGEREIAVDLGWTDQGTYLQVNAVNIRTDREALEDALVRSFREELEL